MASSAAPPLVDRRTPTLIRVLIADDSAAIRTLARHALARNRGFEVVAEAANGSEALSLIELHRPDCVVLDIEMPEMGGFEALAELRHRAPALPVILLSGRTDPAVANRALVSGAVAYLEKGSQMRDLGETIRRITADKPGPVDSSDREVPDSTDDPAAKPPVEPAASAAADLRRLEYVVGHDLGEPLRIIGGFATLLESRYDAVLDESGQSFLRHIRDATDRMQAMLDDLLTYGRAGQLQPEAVAVDLGGLAATVYGALAPQITARGAEVTFGELPTVIGDPKMLNTVFLHLVVNGLTFNRAAVPHVHIDGRRAGAAAVISVADNGIGIDPMQTQRVFELFQRLNAREQFPGTGTGLALCRRLVTLQHGTLELDQAPEIGAVFKLILPAGPTGPGTATPRSGAPA